MSAWMPFRAYVEDVRAAASGRWSEIIQMIGGVSAEVLDGDHHACPSGQCTSTRDAFRVFSDFDESGGCVCNQCGKRADGFAAIQWLTNRPFADSVKAVGDHLGVPRSYENERSKKPKADPAGHLEWLPWNESLAAMWCLQYRPVTPAAIQAAGGRIAKYRGQHTVIALPVWRDRQDSIVGWRIWNVRGTLPRYRKGSPPEQVKSLLTYGSQPGVVGVLRADSADVWKVEGETDMLAMLSAHPGVSVICNSCGAGESPSKYGWLRQAIGEAKRLLIVHDADQPGQAGAAAWAKHFSSAWGTGDDPIMVVNVQLPYPVEPNKGADLRDWITEGHGYDALTQLADRAPVAAVEDTEPVAPEEAEDDPHRLARINLDGYRRDHNGRLVYYQDEWWKYKHGFYRRIATGELRAKVTASIRREFEKCWRAAQERGGDEAEKPVRKVGRGLVVNVIGAMESMCAVASSAPMPCWLPTRKSPNYLTVANGILDLDSLLDGSDGGKLIPHTPDWFSSTKLDYEFDLSARCDRWLDFLNRSMEGDHERIAILQEWAGYLLTTRNDLQRFLCLEGEGGNGKTVYFAAMTAMLGVHNVSHVPLERFAGQFDLGSTVGKAANICGDVGEIDSVAEAELKQFSGGDMMQFDRKNRDPISVAPTAKLMMSWNRRPRFRDRSDGIWRRILLVEFKYKPKAEEIVRGMDAADWWTERGETAGILLWAIAGLKRLRDQGHFTESKLSKLAVEEYRMAANPAMQFLDEYVTEKPGGLISTQRLYQLYCHFCKQTGIRSPLSQIMFGREVVSRFPGVIRTKTGGRHDRQNAYGGIEMSSLEVLSMPVDDDF